MFFFSTVAVLITVNNGSELFKALKICLNKTNGRDKRRELSKAIEGYSLTFRGVKPMKIARFTLVPIGKGVSQQVKIWPK